MGNLPCPSFTPLPDSAFRRQLSAVRERLHALERCCPPGHVAGLADALDAVEAELISLDRRYPDEPLTAHDLEVLAELGCPA